ncbi:MAG: peptidoglycan DD-metalloendopeptidase family protein [Candidatus Xenobiia bacterium LiM19]
MEQNVKRVKKSFLKRIWTIRFVSQDARHVRILKFKPMHIILAITMLITFAAGILQSSSHKVKSKEEQLVALKDATVKQEMIIDRLKVEKKQISTLLEKQNQEIATKLDTIEKKSNEVRKIVGLKTEPAANRKRSIKAARSGSVNLLRLRTDFKLLNHEVNATKTEMEELEKEAISYKHEQDRERMLRMLESIPSIWPASGALSSGFGMRIHPIYGYERYHSGIDISALYGSPIYSTAYGRVTCAGYYSGYGITVMIDHGNGIQTLYGHCSSVDVQQGQMVRKGQIVARIGSTGVSTGPHVHYEVQLAGNPTDPEPYLEYTSSKLALLKKRFGLN